MLFAGHEQTWTGEIMKASNALHAITTAREPAMRVLDPTDRRMSIRWRPPTSTNAEISSPGKSWTGRVLNMSQDGAEVSGLPPSEYDTALELGIRINFQEYAVAWAASLHRIKNNSHILVFTNAPLLREEQYLCSHCGDQILTFGDRARALGTVLVCTLCDTSDQYLSISDLGDLL
tara:strand:- start:43795 stop:44322 length:528 start_codon:yes stop_codon:yes gene_type:complete